MKRTFGEELKESGDFKKDKQLVYTNGTFCIMGQRLNLT